MSSLYAIFPRYLGPVESFLDRQRATSTMTNSWQDGATSLEDDKGKEEESNPEPDATRLEKSCCHGVELMAVAK